MNEADTDRTHMTLKLQALRRDNDQIHELVTFTDGHIVAYLDGLPPSLRFGDLRQAKVSALRELCPPSRPSP